MGNRYGESHAVHVLLVSLVTFLQLHSVSLVLLLYILVLPAVCGYHIMVHMWSAVAQLDSQLREPGFEPRCYRFEVWAFSFTSRRLSRLSCINEYLAIDSGGNVSE